MSRFKIKLSTITTFILATALGAAFFWVSQQVQMLEREQRGIQEQISSEQEGMRVLNAEWDYLNRPDRIESLAAKYLNQMQPVAPDNLLRDANAIPEPQMRQPEDDVPVMVSTGDLSFQKETKVNGVPDARPIDDKEDSKSSDFDGVLKSAAGDDE